MENQEFVAKLKSFRSNISGTTIYKQASDLIDTLEFHNKIQQAEIVKLTNAVEALQRENNELKRGVHRFPDTIIHLPSKVKT